MINSIFFFITILIQISFSVQQKCGELPGVFINGNDIRGGQFFVSSISECCSRCTFNVSCQAFSVTITSSGTFCLLKSAIGINLRLNSQAFSGTKVVSTTTSTIRVPITTRPNPIVIPPSTSITLTTSTSLITSTYTTTSTGTMTTTSQTPTTTTTTTTTTTITTTTATLTQSSITVATSEPLPPTPSTFVCFPEEGIFKYPKSETEILSEINVNPTDCCNICGNVPGCASFSYNKEQNKCFLYAAPTQLESVPLSECAYYTLLGPSRRKPVSK